MLQLEKLTKSYYGKRALQDISLSFPRGEIVGLFGENGAGKTTLMKCILGLLRFEGSVTLDGAPVSRKNIAPAVLRHERALVLPESLRAGAPRFLPRAFPALSRRALHLPDGLFQPADAQAAAHLFHRAEKPV